MSTPTIKIEMTMEDLRLYGAMNQRWGMTFTELWLSLDAALWNCKVDLDADNRDGAATHFILSVLTANLIIGIARENSWRSNRTGKKIHDISHWLFWWSDHRSAYERYYRALRHASTGNHWMKLYKRSRPNYPALDAAIKSARDNGLFDRDPLDTRSGKMKAQADYLLSGS